jgi:arginase
MDVTIIGAPTSAGAYGVGQELAPQALRDAGLVTSLRQRGLQVEDGGDLPVRRFRPDPDRRTAQNLSRVVEVAGEVRDRVTATLRAGRLPVVLGGDCTITLGVIAGLVEVHGDAAVAYLDGDADLSTPSTTRSGILDAMGVAHLLGLPGVAPELAGIGPRRPLLNGARLALVGFSEDDLSDDEHDLLQRQQASLFPADSIRVDPPGAARRVTQALPAASPLVVHLDVDLIDSVELPLAQFPHFNTGLTFDQAWELFDNVCAHRLPAAVVVTEANPLNDPDTVHMPRLVDLMVSALANASNESG